MKCEDCVLHDSIISCCGATHACGVDASDTCHCPDERRAALLAQLSEEDREALERPCDEQPDDIFVVTVVENWTGFSLHDVYLEHRAKYTNPGWRCLGHFFGHVLRGAHVLEDFVDDVERRAESHMLKTGKLEGAHYRAMKDVLAERQAALRGEAAG